MRTSIGIATFLAVGAGAVGVSALSLRGSDTLKDLTIKLLTSTTLECGGVGEPTTDGVTGSLVYEGSGSGNGQAAMVAGTQDVAPMSSRMNTAVCSVAPGKAEGIVFALDGISIVARDTTVAASGGSCAGDPNGCNTDSPSKGLRIDFAGGPGAVALTSCTSAQIVDWRDVLRLVYFGYDASNLTTQNCKSACRTELANGYSKLFESSCSVGNGCTQLKHAFRRNDESGTSDVFQKALLPSAVQISQQNNKSPFCNNGTSGPTIVAPPLTACATSADCNPGGTAGGTCDTSTTSRTSLHCTRLGCSASTPCPGGANCLSTGICDLETNSAPQTNVGQHMLCGCETTSDCSAGSTCDGNTSQCTCTTTADCPAGSGTHCVSGECSGVGPFTCNVDADCPAGLTPAETCNTSTHRCTPTVPACTPQPGHIVETNATTGYGNAGVGSSWVDIQDSDPIRRTCDFTGGNPLEDVCNRDGKLGLVLPIFDATTVGATNPNVQAVTTTDAFPSLSCDTAKFDCYGANAYARDSGGNSIYDLCPDGTNPNAPAATNLCPPHQCAVPTGTSTDSPKDRRCKNARGNLPPPLAAPVDGRLYNLTVWQRLASGQFAIGRYPRSTGQIGSTLYGTTGQIAMQGAFFRLHYMTPTISGSGACQAESATDQISCFAQASWCSFGYAGNSAVNGASVAVNVNNYAPANACIQPLVNNSPNIYPLSRRLFLNSANGFETIDPVANPGETADKKNEYKLAQCYGLDDDGTGPHGEAAKIATAQPPTGFGFVPLGQAPFCDDVAKNICGQTAACGNNTGAIPSQSIDF